MVPCRIGWVWSSNGGHRSGDGGELVPSWSFSTSHSRSALLFATCARETNRSKTNGIHSRSSCVLIHMRRDGGRPSNHQEYTLAVHFPGSAGDTLFGVAVTQNPLAIVERVVLLTTTFPGQWNIQTTGIITRCPSVVL